MKKYLLILAMVFTMGAVLNGCGSKEKTEEKTEDQETADEETAEVKEPETIPAPSLEGVDFDKVVTLGEYKGIALEKTKASVTDEEVQSEIEFMLSSYPEEIAEGGVVEEGDVANIDYAGTLNGKAFDGGTAEGQDLQIGSGSFIEGFEEGLIGLKKGDKTDLKLTFPKDYQSADLAGKEVVFAVTINSISRPLEKPTDEWVAKNTEYKTVAEFTEGMKKDLEDDKVASADEELQSKAWQTVVESSTVNEYPEEALKYGEDVFKQQMETYASYSGQTVEEYVKAQGMDDAAYKEQVKNYSENVCKQMLIMQAIAAKENIKVGDENYQKILQGYLDSNQMSEEEFYKQYDKSNVEQSIMMQMVCECIVDNAKITEVEATPEAEAPVLEEATEEEATGATD